jgi:hypothetical protein
MFHFIIFCRDFYNHSNRPVTASADDPFDRVAERIGGHCQAAYRTC